MKLSVTLILTIMLLTAGCVPIGAVMMAIPVKKGKEKWVTEDYRLRIKKRQGFSGPVYYKLRFKEKGIANKRIKKSIYGGRGRECVYYLPVKEDSVRIDFCKYTIQNQYTKKVKVSKG